MSNPYRDKLKTVGTISRRSGDQVREGVGQHGRFKEITDESGSKVTFHSKGDRKDVCIKPQHVTATGKSGL